MHGLVQVTRSGGHWTGCYRTVFVLVFSLKEWCRLSVRVCVAGEDVNKLPLPCGLKQYVYAMQSLSKDAI